MVVLGAGAFPRVACKASGSCRVQMPTWRFPNHCTAGREKHEQCRTDPKAHL